jgi:hypothetical protein
MVTKNEKLIKQSIVAWATAVASLHWESKQTQDGGWRQVAAIFILLTIIMCTQLMQSHPE